uniref:Uncharacterized protein n=1 Tax=Dulem virus 42 TaxID=3145760 RepID=A0AAU8BA21_9CAUD
MRVFEPVITHLLFQESIYIFTRTFESVSHCKTI